MARRYRRKKDPLDYISLPKIELDPDTKKGIFIVLVLLFGIISFLSLFTLAGGFGVYLARGLTLAFGWGKWLFPVILIVLGLLLYNEDKYYIRGSNYLGLFLFVISFQALLHFFIEVQLWREIVVSGAGGGYLGMSLALIFHNIIGFWGSLIILLGFLLISLMLMLDTSLNKLIGSESILASAFYPFKALFSKLFGEKDREEKEEDEEEDEEEDSDVETHDDASEEEIEFSNKEVSEDLEFPEPLPEKKKVKEETGWKTKNVKIDLPLSLLNSKKDKPTSGDIKNNAFIIQKTLENFGIVVEMGEVSVGPTVTQYTFKPAEGVKLSRITSLNNDLALALAAHPIRIEAPIPGRALVGIEVPNQTKAVVGLRETLESGEFKGRKNNLTVALGKDVSGKSWVYDIGKMPHLLVAGATGSGKSVCLNSIIVSLLYQNNPEDLRFILVDPKRVELPIYNSIPHLLTPVITNVSKTINALKWCLNEMDQRFETLSQTHKRNIQAYNENLKPGQEKMPYIVFIIDELADLMVAAGRDIEGGVIRLAQMARAVGIHLVLATQRPSVDVITGLIKANMPTRIAFSVASGVDSKTILDSLGAEKLLGQGDMLFITAEISKPKRLQGAFVSDQEIKRITNYIRANGGGPDYVPGITEKQKVHGIAGVGLAGGGGDDEDELVEEAKELIINSGKASASFLQRRLSIGYARAARLLDILEENGIIGPSDGAKAREIMVSKEQYEGLLNQGVSGVSLHKKEEAEEPDEYLEDEDDDVETQDFASDDDDVKTRFIASQEEMPDEEEEEEMPDKEEEDVPTEEDETPDDAPRKEDRGKNKNNKSSDDEDDGIYFAR
ncbi:MAG: DNA translocase FtsK 4TM domain-containing protein [Patescibacteria group bacterium]|nr:DNA translocase FtsK 4TM domain-containing protein [Patescibacteria group bacterium]